MFTEFLQENKDIKFQIIHEANSNSFRYYLWLKCIIDLLPADEGEKIKEKYQFVSHNTL